MMQFQSDALYRDTLAYESKFHNYSTSTNLYLNEESTDFNQAKEHSLHSEQTLPELPKSTQIAEGEWGGESLPFEQQIIQITQRFEQIHRIFILHSERESQIHEKRCDYKQMKIDWTQLSPDFTNKITIVQDLRRLAQAAQGAGVSEEERQLLQTKFQQYYLERHYGGLKCEINDLSIQERDESINEKQFLENQSCSLLKNQSCSLLENPERLQGLSSIHRSEESLEYINIKEVIGENSQIGGYISLVNQSKLSYIQDCCQTIQESYSISVEIPRIIEIEIPMIIYRVKEKVITYDESDLEAPYKDIDEIIDKYSRPYEELYLDSGKQIKIEGEAAFTFEDFNSVAHQTNQSHSLNHIQIGSIMLDSNVMELNKEMTEVELTYSHLPHEQLLMDSFAQIGSLISNNDSLGDRLGDYEHDPHLENGTIVITEKLNSRSILEKYEESERLLNEENIELKEEVSQLRLSLAESEKKRKELSAMNSKLASRLEDEIEQGIYLNKKLDELDAELLEEKVSCLTHLNECKQRKIENLTSELKQKCQQLEMTRNELQQLRIIDAKTEELLIEKEQELAAVSKHLMDREEQLYEINNCEQDMIKIVSYTEISLKGEIDKLEQEKTEMREKLTEFQKRVENDGINLQYEEAQEIQGIIESREHVHRVEITELTTKYQDIIEGFKTEVEQLKDEIKILHELSQAKSELTCTTIKEKRILENYIPEFEALIEEYDRELESKDQQIMNMKQEKQFQHHLEINSQEEFEEFVKEALDYIKILNASLERERVERLHLTERLVAVDNMVNRSRKTIEENEELLKYQSLVESLTEKLEKILSQNAELKDRLETQAKCYSESLNSLRINPQTEHLQSLKTEITKLRKVNTKLKKYTTQIQAQLLSISGMNRCESHRLIISTLTQQRNYYLGLLSN